MTSDKTLYLLLAIYALLFSWLAVAPYDRAVWWAENIPIMLIVTAIVFIHARHFAFSPLSYFLMFFLILMHTVGGHYTFERVPFDAVNDFFGFERNNYDRFAHFSVGFYAYAMAEYLLLKKRLNSRVILYLFPIMTIFAVAGIYEIFEWQYAVSADETAGIAVLGSQGDVWDAQKDMLSDGMGAISAVLLFAYVRRDDLRKVGSITR